MVCMLTTSLPPRSSQRQYMSQAFGQLPCTNTPKPATLAVGRNIHPRQTIRAKMVAGCPSIHSGPIPALTIPRPTPYFVRTP